MLMLILFGIRSLEKYLRKVALLLNQFTRIRLLFLGVLNLAYIIILKNWQLSTVSELNYLMAGES